jgi:hypothetical protein
MSLLVLPLIVTKCHIAIVTPLIARITTRRTLPTRV